jgi:putative protein kinase ArgK-like GTPase of G3E family
MLTPKYEDIPVEFLTVSSIKKIRIDLAWEKIQKFIEALKEKEIFESQRKEQELNWFKRLVEDEVLRVLWSSKENKIKVKNLMDKIRKDGISPSKAAKELLDNI